MFSFLATPVALHFIPVSKSVGGRSFSLQPSSVAWSLFSFDRSTSDALKTLKQSWNCCLPRCSEKVAPNLPQSLIMQTCQTWIFHQTATRNSQIQRDSMQKALCIDNMRVSFPRIALAVLQAINQSSLAEKLSSKIRSIQLNWPRPRDTEVSFLDNLLVWFSGPVLFVPLLNLITLFHLSQP